MGLNTFNLLGSPVPIGGDATNATSYLGLAPVANDTIATWQGGAVQNWSPPSAWTTISHKWNPATTIAPGQGFFYFSKSVNTWTSNFTVQ
jgi:hypothetical protein